MLMTTSPGDLVLDPPVTPAPPPMSRNNGAAAGYEGLLQKNVAEKKSGAGQYFIPRALIVCMLRLLKPKPGEVVQDPAAGTGGFLVAADRFIKERSDGLFALPKAQQELQRRNAFTGLELVPGAHRLLMMNLLLHGIEPDSVKGGDALGPDGEGLGQADLILSNPPFGTKKGNGRPVRSDFTCPSSNDLRPIGGLCNVVFGLFVVEIKLRFGDASSGAAGWLCA